MIKSQLKARIDNCFAAGVKAGYWSEAAAGRYTVEVPRHEGQGDFSTNMALVVAGCDKCNPRRVAMQLADMLRRETDIIEKVEVAGPGFVNLEVNQGLWSTVLAPVVSRDEDFGLDDIGRGKRVLVEFVSANPTGPLSLGHGRNAVLGDTIARLLEAVGHEVTREYYFNDAGRQMRVLGASTRARYLELLGLDARFPEDGYQGEYIHEIAARIRDEEGDSLRDAGVEVFKERAQEAIFSDIDRTLRRMDIRFDSYFNEHTLYEKGLIDDVVAQLRKKGLVYDQDGAVWFKTSTLGLEKDRVIIKSSGEPTYRLPDIAYHREKFRRGFDWMINVFGADHIATVPDVMAGVRSLGYDDSKITTVLYQFVTLLRDGKQVKMSTRKATFVTIDELLDEVGRDAMRFFFLMRKADSQLEFDLELAKKESQENPVYYVQYAHARLCSILRLARERQCDIPDPGEASLERLCQAAEFELLRLMADYPALVRGAALDLAPHRLIFYLMELAGRFHSYYNKHKVISDDLPLTGARLCLVNGLRIVLRNGLRLAGLTAPEKM